MVSHFSLGSADDEEKEDTEGRVVFFSHWMFQDFRILGGPQP